MPKNPRTKRLETKGPNVHTLGDGYIEVEEKGQKYRIPFVKLKTGTEYIDPRHLYELARIHCSDEEIASIYRVTVDTLSNRFSEIIDFGRGVGKAGLRRSMYKNAEEFYDTGAQKFLAMNYLRMAEKHEDKTEITTKDEKIEALHTFLLKLINEK